MRSIFLFGAALLVALAHHATHAAATPSGSTLGSGSAIDAFAAQNEEHGADAGTEKDDKTYTPPTPPPPASDADAEEALARFDIAFNNDAFDLPILKTHNQIEAIEKLAEFDHKNVTKKLTAIIKSRKIDEKVWAAAVDGLANMHHNGKSALSTLRRQFDPNKAAPERTVHVVRTLGALKDKKMRDDCIKLFLHKEDLVAIEGVRALGNIGDRTVLPKMRELFELNTRDPSKGVSVRVDTGSAGSADRARARAAGKRMEVMIRGERELLLKTMREALTKLCGEKIETPEELREWMLKNKNKW